MPPIEIYTRNWGTETVFAFTSTHAGKVLTRKAGTKGGFQLHIKEESHYVYSGTLKLETVDVNGDVQERIVTTGESWTVEPGVVHREEALEDSVVIEVSDPTKDDRYPIVPDPGGLSPMTDQQALEKLTALARNFRQRAAAMEKLAVRIGMDGLQSLVPAGVKPLVP